MFCELHPGTHVEPLNHITGYLCRDDYVAYPHVLEPLQISHKYDWFSEEVRRDWNGPVLGTSGLPVAVAAHRKISQICVANVDFVTSRAHQNVMGEQREDQGDIGEYTRLMNSIRLCSADILRKRGDIVLYEWTLKVHREDVLYTHMFTFPHSAEFQDGYVTAFLISSDLRFLVYKHLLENVASRAGHIDLITPAHCLNGFSVPLDAMQRGNATLGSIMATWLRCFSSLTKDTICHAIVQDLMAPFMDVQAKRVNFGSPNSIKAVLLAIGIKVSMVLSPNLHAYNRQYTAVMLMDFFATFFERAYNPWTARDGWGRTAEGEVIRDWTREVATRRTSVIQSFTVLRPPGEAPRGVNPREWQLLTNFWNFFCVEDVSMEIGIPDTGYRIRGRRVRLPGAIYTPGSGDSGDWLPLQNVLHQVDALGSAYQEVFYAGRDRLQSAATREAVSHTLAMMSRYIVGFSQFFHSTYCAIYRLAALHPELWFDCGDPGDAWRTLYAVRENAAHLALIHNVTAPYARPARAVFPEHEAIAPLSPSQGVTAFSRLVAPGCVYRAGMRSVDQTVDLPAYVDMWNSNNAEQCVREYETSLVIGRQMMEVLGIIAGISTGGLLHEPVLSEFIVRALSRGTLNTNSTVALMRAFGVAPNGSDLVRKLDTVEYRTIHQDPRVFRLEYGTVEQNETFVVMGGENRDYIRASVRRNFHLLCNAVFGERYEMHSNIQRERTLGRLRTVLK